MFVFQIRCLEKTLNKINMSDTYLEFLYLLLGMCSSVLLIACVVVSAAAAGGSVGIKTAIAVAVAAVCACVGGILAANMKKKTR